MKRSMSSASNSQKWSEPILILGKGIPSYSTKYGCLTCCLAGVGESSSWVRLYPLFAEPVIPTIQPVEKFDVIKVEYRHRRPERLRPESRKIYPESAEKIDHIDDERTRNRILHQYTESGGFLHDNSWQGKKTLGMISPCETVFSATRGVPRVRFKCSDACNGHTCEVGEFKRFDSVGRVIPETENEVKNRLDFLQGKQLLFLMGTDSRHPQRWLLISVHTIGGN